MIVNLTHTQILCTKQKLMFKTVLTKEDLKLLAEINEYLRSEAEPQKIHKHYK